MSNKPTVANTRIAYASLSKGLILDVAEKIVANEGLDTLSFRKIAAACGSGVTSLYKHFDNKHILLAALLDRRVLNAGIIDHSSKDPKSWLLETCLRMYQELIREIHFIPLFCDPNYTGPASLSLVNRIYQVLLEDCDINNKEASRTVHALLSFVNGAALQHAANHKRDLQAPTQAYMDAFIDKLDWENDYASVLKTVTEYDKYIAGQHIKDELTHLIDIILV